jgi:hypothetical protein
MTSIEQLKEYALLSDNVWLLKKLEIAELEIEVATINEVTGILGLNE